MFERALTLRERANGPVHTALVGLLIGLAEADVALGERDAAVARIDRAMAIAAAEDTAFDIVARARFAKAKLSWADPDARAAAITLAEQARDGLPASSTDRSDVEAWLASR